VLEQVERLEKRVNEVSTRQGGLEERQAEENETLRRVKELLKNSDPKV
jgi:phage gp37-like protein